MKDLYDMYEEAVKLLIKSRKYLQIAHHDAEGKHDSYGEYYMDSNQYEIMEETEKLIIEIDKYEEELNATNTNEA